MNHQFTERLGAWLRERPDTRDYAAGCKMFLQLTARVNMYKNLLAAPDMPRLETELQKHYDFRVAELTHAQVEAMDAQAATIAEQQPQPQTEATASKPAKLLVFKRSRNNGFYVYLLGVMPDQNIGCNCRTAKSAMRFMLWKKRELGASISESHFSELKQLAAAEG